MEYGDIINLYCKIKEKMTLKELEFRIWLYLNEDLIYYENNEKLYDERDIEED